MVSQNFTCRDCGATRATIEDYIDHVVWDHVPRSLQRRPEQSVAHVGEEQQQQPIAVQEEQPSVQVEAEQQQQANSLIHTCVICKKTFTRKDSLKRHAAIHMREILTNHVNFHNIPHRFNYNNQPAVNNEPVEHQPEDPAASTANEQCMICQANISAANLNRHMQRFHSPWVAPYCEDTKRVHNPDLSMSQPKECKECGLWFMNNHPFAMHMNEHGLALSEIKAALNVST